MGVPAGADAVADKRDPRMGKGQRTAVAFRRQIEAHQRVAAAELPDPGEMTGRFADGDPHIGLVFAVPVEGDGATDAQIDHCFGEPVGETLGHGQCRPDLFDREAQAAMKDDLQGVLAHGDFAQRGIAQLGGGRPFSVGGAHCSLSRWSSRASRRSAQAVRKGVSQASRAASFWGSRR